MVRCVKVELKNILNRESSTLFLAECITLHALSALVHLCHCHPLCLTPEKSSCKEKLVWKPWRFTSGFPSRGGIGAGP